MLNSPGHAEARHLLIVFLINPYMLVIILCSAQTNVLMFLNVVATAPADASFVTTLLVRRLHDVFVFTFSVVAVLTPP